MPANWPSFINNVSNKLSSRTLDGPIEMGTFIASEYFRAVSTAQTLFGDIHVPGSLPVLTGVYPPSERLITISDYPAPIGEIDPNDRGPEYPEELINPAFGAGPVKGYTKAFQELHSTLESTDPNIFEPVSNPTVEEKFTIEEYSDFNEGYPEIKPFNVTCEFEEWIEENKDKIDPFEFYEFFKKNRVKSCVL